MNYKNYSFSKEVAKLDINNDEDIQTISSICEALSHPLRIKILKQLQEKQLSIPQLAELNNISITTCVFHVNLLNNVGLIRMELVPGETRNVRMCYRLTRQVDINIYKKILKTPRKSYKNICKVGEFIDYSDDAQIRYATKDEMVLFENPYSRNRYKAEIIWSVAGTISYGFPNPTDEREDIEEIDIYLELCSEVAEYNNEYKSDITFWLNNIELFSYTSPGDYGDRKGVYNPDWWNETTVKPTQYGDLLHICIKKNLILLNDIIVNKNFNIQSLNLNKKDRIVFKLGNKSDALYRGGWNIFGKSFGDYPIDIEMEVFVEEKQN